ncbi:MAG: shikimate dehydrogenase, partial [Lachnospiraceae bacterium]|nr:shikimate dehydrogenase [Lachnospiraceae bacterium]
MNKVNIDTKMITLIGKPLGQSFAARMQNAGYAAANLNYLYHYTEADSSHLKEIIDGVRYMPSYAGCAVTKPNKVAVMQYLDETDPLCKKIGSCNTVVKTPEGKLRGYNTDALGFYRSLVENGKMEAEGKTFFCFGAGGVGRAICCILAVKGAKRVYITDIYPQAAE